MIQADVFLSPNIVIREGITHLHFAIDSTEII
jgi:hypothetical protein